MAEDRFANVFTAETVMSAINTLTFSEMNFGITLRDRVAIVIDTLYFWPLHASIALMTATGDFISVALTVSDQVTNIGDLADRRILHEKSIIRHDLGTAAGGQLLYHPYETNFSPPLIALPNRLFMGVVSGGLASVATVVMRMHFRTVSITQDQQLVEVLEAFQLST